MIFSSPSFLFYFFPVALVLGYLFNGSPIVLLLLSLVFYAWGEPALVLLLLFVIVFNYWIGEAIFSRPDRGRWLFVFGISTDLALLIVFKYSDFIIGNLNYVLQATGAGELPLPRVPLPLGISFFTFQAIAYLTDVFGRRIVPAHSLLQFAVFKSFFPQLIAGPIVRYQQIASDLNYDKRSVALFASGAGRFVVGLAKKVIIADNLALPADQLFALPAGNHSFTSAWAAALCFTLQIYFDFSGYSDMAIGIARMFGVRFPENFRYPYTSRSIQEFWRRWHITLSSWFRDYVYIPLGGSRRGSLRTCVNLLIVFALCGFWHGPTWVFLIWGLYHGAFLMLERTPFGSLLTRAPLSLQHLYVMVVIVFGWILFRSPSFAYALEMWKAMFGANGWYHSSIVWPVQFPAFNTFTVIVLLLGVAASVPWTGFLRAGLSLVVPERKSRYRFTTVTYPVGLAVLMVLSFAFVSTQHHLAFIYFRF
jgi:alginate O-acetyltransferase complex protein AlgI